jgi:hypothetical protein
MELNWYKVTLCFEDMRGQEDTMYSVSSLDAMIGSLQSFKHSTDKRKVIALAVEPCVSPEDGAN